MIIFMTDSNSILMMVKTNVVSMDITAPSSSFLAISLNI